MKKFISVILSATMLFGGLVTVKAQDTKYYFADNFNSYESNTSPSTIEFSGVEHMRIKDDGTDNKAFYIPDSSFDAEISVPFEREDDVFTFSFDLKRFDNLLNISIKLYDTGAQTYMEFMNIKNNIVFLSDGKRLCGINTSKYQEIACTVDTANKVYSIYFNGRCLEERMYSGDLGKSLKLCLSKTGGDLQSSMYMDNVFIYSGSYKDNASMKTVGYNAEGKDYLEIDNDHGDHAFFNNKFLNDLTNTYENSQPYMSFASQPKTNKIVYDRYDRFNPERTSDAIHLYKTTSNDCFFDIYLNKKYPYILVRSDFTINKFGSPIDLFHIRDNKTTSTAQNDYQVQVTESGALMLFGKKIKTLSPGETFNVAVCYDLQDGTCDAYLNNELVVKDGTFNSEIKYITMVRTNINFGGTVPCDLHVDNYEIIGMHKNYVPDDSNRNTVFPPDDVYEEYLADKNAFNSNSNVIWANGQKNNSDKAFKYENEEMFVPVSALNTAFGFEITDSADGKSASGSGIEFKADSNEVVYQGEKYTMSNAAISENGGIYVPVKKFASEVLGKDVKDDGMGMVLVSDNPIKLDFENEVPEYRRDDTGWGAEGDTPESPIKGLNYYLTYQRPTAEMFRSKFYDENGNAPSHPRIMVTRDDIDELKKLRYTDEKLGKRIDAVIAKADDKLDDAVPTYYMPDKLRLLDQSRATLQFTENLGLAYLITGEKKYADKCWEAIEAVCSFPDWNISHVIDAGEMLPAVAIGYDWIYDTLNDDQKKLVENAICKFGLEPLQLAYYGRLTGGKMSPSWRFPKWKSNFNTVVNGGVTVGALAVAETNPDLCFDILEKATRSLEYTLRGFAPEGAWIESIAYWGMTMQNICYYVEVMDSVYGDDFGIMNAPGLKDSWKYPYYFVGNAGMNNFHDMHIDNYDFTLELLTYAKLYNNPYVFELRDEVIESGKSSISARDVIRYVPNMEKADMDKLPLDYNVEGLEGFSARSSWTDKDGMFFSAHAGPVDYYHSQVDVGTFVLDMNGKRWAEDLPPEDYAYINHGNYSFKDIYRRRAEAHNVVVINPDDSSGQNWDGFGPTIRFESKDKGAICEYDMTDVYKGQVNDYKRGFMMTDDRTTAIIRDEIELAQNADTIYWFMTTKADVIINDENSSAMLIQNGLTMNLDFESSDKNAKIEVMKAEPLSTSPNPQGQSSNAEYNRIAIKLSGKQNERVTITVRLSDSMLASNQDIMQQDIADWRIPDGELVNRKENMKLDYLVVDGKKYDISEKIRYYDGEERPVITQIVAKNPDCRTAFEYFNENNMEGYKVNIYSPDETYHTQYILLIEKDALPADVMGYKRYPVKSIYASEEPESQNNKWNIIDQDLSTRWTTYSIDAYGIIDLGEVKSVDAIAVSFWKGSERVYRYELYCSEDGENYTKMADIATSGQTEDYELNELGTYNARYIKFVNKGNSATDSNVNQNSNITEFAVLKRACETCSN